MNRTWLFSSRMYLLNVPKILVVDVLELSEGTFSKLCTGGKSGSVHNVFVSDWLRKRDFQIQDACSKRAIILTIVSIFVKLLLYM